MSRISRLPWTPVWQAARHWSTESVARSRRNALAANTALAARRAEREDVEAYLAAHSEGIRLPEQRRELG
jgi:hypothetical protein